MPGHRNSVASVLVVLAAYKLAASRTRRLVSVTLDLRACAFQCRYIPYTCMYAVYIHDAIAERLMLGLLSGGHAHDG
jgi:hypothetical protein